MYTENRIPQFMTIKQVAAMGILSEYCLRHMVKEGKIPVVFSGKKALINFDAFCAQLNSQTVSL